MGMQSVLEGSTAGTVLAPVVFSCLVLAYFLSLGVESVPALDLESGDRSVDHKAWASVALSPSGMIPR